MIIDLSNKKSREISKSKYDICIVGSGPAGLTIANELANSNLRVCVLESGKNKKAKYADSLRKVASTGIQIKEDSSERIFGGTSYTWGGLSSVFNKDNLEVVMVMYLIVTINTSFYTIIILYKLVFHYTHFAKFKIKSIFNILLNFLELIVVIPIRENFFFISLSFFK